MKKILLLMAVLSVVAISAEVKEGVGRGYKGDIKLSVEVEGDKIVDIKVLESKETPRIGGKALPKLIEQAIAKQTVEVDTVAGASNTSRGFREALANALGK
ncbi:Predicted NADH:ubiquinone oxidoreductase, subunit RnfG [Fusobacterium necrogenes]|uniref:Predicted NADH:ubiquinone oxidoreductase, subunit RnfG n=1 Tax=Fusobacterium necrogenes TaxID=858 RepID=A0A377GW42_9FUSO|nr:FMN-binding protein [Fusobacterium necrogenes]STO31156.1 Predicted NADH:ubiquinone oxidoreductase, subunit RnfG [Fusobacterium necrogenes]